MATDTPPLLSIVIPTHNTRELVLRCVASVLEIDCIPVETIVVDDGSNDESTAAVRRQHPDVRVVRLENRSGFSHAVNIGVGHTSGKLLLILNSDAEIKAAGVPSLVRLFEDNPRLGIAGAALSYPNGSPQWAGGRWPTMPWLMAVASGLPSLLATIPGYRRVKPAGPREHRSVDWVSGTAMTLRRLVWEEVGPFDEEFRFYCQDLALCRSAHNAGWSVTIAPGFEVTHNLGATISRREGSIASFNPTDLWCDLVRYVRLFEDPSSAQKAATVLRLGATARILARRAITVLQRADRRRAWRRDTDALITAQQALSSLKDETWHQDHDES